MAQPIRVLVAHGQTLLRRSLAMVLNTRHGIRVVGETANRMRTLIDAQALEPDVIVLHLDLPDGGAPLVADLAQRLPRSAILLLLDSADTEAAVDALQAGARGFLHRNCTPDDVVHAIRRMRHGELVVPHVVADSMLNRLEGDTSDSVAQWGLTRRELDVLALVARGHTNLEIARALRITERTAKGYLAKILDKLGLENRVQLATFALQHELVRGRGDDVLA